VPDIVLNFKNLSEMKTLKLVILSFVIISLAGCKYKKEAEQLQITRQDLTSRLAKSDSTLGVYLSIINDIGRRLDSLAMESNTPQQAAAGNELRDRLNTTVNAIRNLMNENDKRYQALRSRYAGSNSKLASLESEITGLNTLVEQKDSLINVLNVKIAGLNGTIEEQNLKLSDLSNENVKKDESIESAIKKLNTAYFISGADKDLQDKNIIAKEGGFLGFLGRVDVVSPAIDKSSLEMLDIREKKVFDIQSISKKVSCITYHPAGSYELKENGPDSSQLTVTDPEKFWEDSKLLIVAY